MSKSCLMHLAFFYYFKALPSLLERQLLVRIKWRAASFDVIAYLRYDARCVFGFSSTVPLALFNIWRFNFFKRCHSLCYSIVKTTKRVPSTTNETSIGNGSFIVFEAEFVDTWRAATASMKEPMLIDRTQFQRELCDGNDFSFDFSLVMFLINLISSLCFSYSASGILWNSVFKEIRTVNWSECSRYLRSFLYFVKQSLFLWLFVILLTV